MNRISKIFIRICAFACAFLLSLSVMNYGVWADQPPIIDDGANLFTAEQEKELLIVMEELHNAGGVALVTNPKSKSYNGEASSFAKRLCNDYFKGESGTVLLIDMYNRRIEIYSTGKLYKYINKSRANAITGNTYMYATNGDYFTCAKLCLEQMAQVASGGKIAMPLKNFSNFLLAISLALVVTYIVALNNRKRITFGDDIDNVTEKKTSLMSSNAVEILKKNRVKYRKTVHSDSSSGGGGSYSGGSSGGGGGGGGGHSF